MTWDRTKTIALAPVSCSYCHGYGMRLARNGKEVPCHCVFRAIFRACYNRFRECVAKGPHTSAVTIEFCRGAEGHRTYSRKREEFMADFCLISRRVLDEPEHKIFRFHFLLRADWKLCCERFHIDRGIFFHYVYRIQQKLGRAFAEIEPYALFPLDEYFSGMIRRPVASAARPVASAARPAIWTSRAPKSPASLPLSA